MLEMVGPYLEKTITDKRELNREKIKALIQAPSAFGLINNNNVDNITNEEEGEEQEGEDYSS
jgi:hypothetical protein